MKRYSLTGFYQKFICLIIITFLGLINILNYSVFPVGNTTKITFLVLTIIINLIYFYLSFFPRIIINTNNKTLTVKFINKTTINFMTIKNISLEEKQIQNKDILIINLYNDKDEIFYYIHTYFNTKQKQQANKIVLACQELIN